MYIHRRSHALRKGRVSIEGQVYLLTTATLGRRRWFEDFWIGSLGSRALTQPPLWADAKRLAWVLMPDHVHALVQLGPGATLARLMQRIKAVTAMEVGRATGARGIWEHGYHDRAIRREEDIRDVARYIIANPLRAGLVSRVGDYPFWDSIWLDPASDPLDM